MTFCVTDIHKLIVSRQPNGLKFKNDDDFWLGYICIKRYMLQYYTSVQDDANAFIYKKHLPRE